MSKQSNKPVSLVVTAALVSGLGLSGTAFAMSDLAQGYLLGAGAATGEGEGHGMAMDTNKDGRISPAEFAAAHKGDSSKFAEHDPNNDGFISADEMKAHKHDKHGTDKKAAEKKTGDKGMEGKCGGMA